MLRVYGELGMQETAVFSLFVRSLPRQRNFLLACGLDDLLRAELEALHFTPEDIAYLSSLDLFPPDCLDRLSRFSFTGDVFAMAEGTPFFANEPILEIVAPLPGSAARRDAGSQPDRGSNAARVKGDAKSCSPPVDTLAPSISDLVAPKGSMRR